jgi:asparagine synthase (glutamine-hydrolysing)
MRASVESAAVAPSFQITADRPWHKAHVDVATVWFSGHLLGPASEGEAAALAVGKILLPIIDSPASISAALLRLHGHFAFIIQKGEKVLLVADRVRSIPISFAERNGVWSVDVRPRRLARAMDMRPGNLDLDGVFAVALSGYTIGQAGIYNEIHGVQPGEFVILSGNRKASRHLYYVYRSWLASPVERPAALKRLKEVTLGIIENLRDSLDGREVVVPLSSGLDSRLIVSGLHHVGYRQVRCFAYGLPGNHELEISRQVAEKLGYPWSYWPRSHAQARDYASSQDRREFIEFADNLDGFPTEHDNITISKLMRRRELPDDAIVVNGQSGDFITGGHIARSLVAELADAKDLPTLYSAIETKHFSNWPTLSTAQTRQRLQALLASDLRACGAPVSETDRLWALYELSELRNRQVKHVINGQRCYERLGLGWRLPLWDNDYLDFWEGVPLEYKRNQSLYREMLLNADWGAAWKTIPFGQVHVRPWWLWGIRRLAMLAAAPLGRRRWHDFDRRFFLWRYERTAMYGMLPYRTFAFDSMRPQNLTALLAREYLENAGTDVEEILKH